MPPGQEAAAVLDAGLTEHLVGKGDIEVERSRVGRDPVGHIRNRQSLHLPPGASLRLEDRRDRRAGGSGGGDLGEVLLEGLPLNEERGVIDERGEQFAGRDVLAPLDG